MVVQRRLTRCGEVRLECNCVRAVIALAVTISYTVVTRREQDGNAASTESGKSVAHAGGVVLGDSLLVVAIRGGECLRDGRLVADVLEEVEVGLRASDVSYCHC